MFIMKILIKSIDVAKAVWKKEIIKRMDMIWYITEIYREMKKIKEENFGFEEFAYSGSNKT